MTSGATRRSTDQRTYIAERAAELFARSGYAATSMNEIAEASNLSKPGLYHHFGDKAEVLLHITDGHVSRLVEIVQAVEARKLPAEQRLPSLITAFVAEYAQAQSAHRVLTEDVRFLLPEAQARVLDKERVVVQVFANAVAALRPDIQEAQLHKVLTMLLFGMLNWMFTWFRADGPFDYEQMAPIATQLFLNGVMGIEVKKRPYKRADSRR
ncbi:MAG: TetR family transcriptional regulator [Proteobacteria bacterium]|nr:TetR family transcriptional regulator [Pseudomonadota bacterium]